MEQSTDIATELRDEENKVKMEDREFVALHGNDEESVETGASGAQNAKGEEEGEEEKLGDVEDEGDEEAEEGEEEDTYREPILDGRNITFKTRILNQYLLCSLCMGYFRDANTIIECLHTFCKSCIYKYLREHGDCPQCGVNLGTYPYEKLKFDRQVQTMVDKILPEMTAKDLQLEREFYEKRGIKLDLPKPPGGPKKLAEEEREEPVAKKIKKSELKKFYSDEVSFELMLDENEKSGQLKNLDKPFIRTSAKVTVKHLKKYLQKKLGLESIKELEITYRGEPLGTEHSLEYILKTRGLDTRTKNPLFKYKIKQENHMLY